MKPGLDPEYDQALAMALKMLRARDWLTAEIRARCLSKGCNPEKTEQVLDYLVQKSILNDEPIANALAESWIAEKSWGPLRIENELVSKGLEQETAQQIALSKDYSQSFQRAVKKQANKSPEGIKRRLYQLGYPEETLDQFELE